MHILEKSSGQHRYLPNVLSIILGKHEINANPNANNNDHDPRHATVDVLHYRELRCEPSLSKMRVVDKLEFVVDISGMVLRVFAIVDHVVFVLD